MAVPDLAELYRHYFLKLLVPDLQGLAGKPTAVVMDPDRFTKEVVDATWLNLPLPLRMLGRDKVGWDRFLHLARAEAFVAVPGGKLAVRPDVAARLDALVERFVRQPQEPTAAPRATPPAAAPSPTAAPNAVAVGIDLGTTYSVVAHLDAHGRPVSIVNAAGDVLTPSVILLEDAGPVVGKEAVLAAAMEPDRVAVCVKRDMGAPAYRKKVNGESMPPEVLSSFILRALKADAERKLGPVKCAVITVPAYFDETRRRATVDAGRLAGLEVLDIINEPTAAALAYGYEQGFLNPRGESVSARPLRVLVYDLGGGTFDVTIVEIQGSAFRALATDGDVALGGKDWDEALVEIAAEAFTRQHGQSPLENPSSLLDLFLSAETAKKTLSERPRATVFVNHQGTRFKAEVTRARFEEVTAPLLSRTRTTTEIVVRQAGLTWAAIDKVLLVGGSTRMPQVQRMLQELTGKAPEQSVSVDEAVAHGAALYADLRLHQQAPGGGPAPFRVTNINSHSLGIVGVDPATGRRRNQVLIPKNTPLPHTVSATFKTHKPGQSSVAIRVVEGESANPEACVQIGVCTIKDLPRHLPAGTPVRVSYSYQADGRLQVSGQVVGHAAAGRTAFHRENSLDAEQMHLWAQYLDAVEG
jgi:molecular chaperone DnaK